MTQGRMRLGAVFMGKLSFKIAIGLKDPPIHDQIGP